MVTAFLLVLSSFDASLAGSRQRKRRADSASWISQRMSGGTPN